MSLTSGRTPSPPSTRDPQASRVSVPPSEPRGSRTSFSQIDVGDGRPARLQLIVALVLFLFLFAIPLYLWRRPRAESIAVAAGSDAGVAMVEPPPPAPPDDKPVVSDPKVMLCQDPGPKKTAPEQCDHLIELEKSFVKAVEETASCAKDGGGGAVVYVADVSFKRHAIGLATPKEGRTLKNAKAVTSCHAAVKAKLATVALEGSPHAHARYKIQVTATYPAPAR